MSTRLSTGLLLLGLSAALAAPAFAADDAPIYGSQLMTQQERQEFRTRMRNAASAEEREQIRNEHHEQMRKRAAEMGVELPEQPPARGGKGMGPGQGMGPGKGMGQGGGMGGGMGGGKGKQ